MLAIPGYDAGNFVHSYHVDAVDAGAVLSASMARIHIDGRSSRDMKLELRDMELSMRTG